LSSRLPQIANRKPDPNVPQIANRKPEPNVPQIANRKPEPKATDDSHFPYLSERIQPTLLIADLYKKIYKK